MNVIRRCISPAELLACGVVTRSALVHHPNFLVPLKPERQTERAWTINVLAERERRVPSNDDSTRWYNVDWLKSKTAINFGIVMDSLTSNSATKVFLQTTKWRVSEILSAPKDGAFYHNQ
jgi:hypothetical protein